jgi:hypothetical protein
MTEYQQAAIFRPAQHSIVEGSTKAGKTFPCLCWLLQQAMQRAGNNRAFWWVAPVYGQAEIAYRRLVREMLWPIDSKQTWWHKNDGDLFVRFNNGSTIYFKTAEKPDNLYGEDVYAAVGDECSRWREASWTALLSTMTATSGPVRLIGNVKGKKNWAYRLARMAQAGNLPGWDYGKFTVTDALGAGLITQATVDNARRLLPKSVFDELYNAEASDDGSNPFGLEAIERAVRPLVDKPSEIFGIDLARKMDWTVVRGMTFDGEPTRFERWRHVPWSETVDRIVSIIGNVPALVDATGVGDPIADTLQRRGCQITPFIFTARSKQQLVERLSHDINAGQVGILDGVERGELEEMEYTYSETGVRYSAPEGLHDDAAWGLALCNTHRTSPATSGAWCVSSS